MNLPLGPLHSCTVRHAEIYKLLFLRRLSDEVDDFIITDYDFKLNPIKIFLILMKLG